MFREIFEKLNEKNNREEKESDYFPLVLAIYIAAGIVFLLFYRYQVNTDGFAYISIAEKYSLLDFKNAVNGFWSPLYSWLLATLLAIGIESLLATKILGLILGAILFFGLKRFSRWFNLSEQVKKVTFFTLIPIIIYFAVSVTTPDLLVVIFLIYYLSFIFSPEYPRKKSMALMCGVLGGAAYLAKTYAFLFFVIHFSFLNIFFYLRSRSSEEKKNIVINFFVGFMAFLIISGAWIAAISLKYEELVIGTTGEYNLAAYGPGAKGDPLDYLGFLEPSDEHALSIWDDPGLIPLQSSADFLSLNNINHLLETSLKNNIKTFGPLYAKFSPVSLLVFCLYLTALFYQARKKIFSERIFYLIITILIFQTVYTFIHIEERYIWLVYLVLLFMTGQLLFTLFKIQSFSKIKKTILIFFILGSFAIIPAFKLFYRVNTGQEFYLLSERLKQYQIAGKVASNKNWSETLATLFYLKAQYYGTPKQGVEEELLSEQLKEYDIDYYFFWNERQVFPEFLKDKKELLKGDIPGLEIYYLK